MWSRLRLDIGWSDLLVGLGPGVNGDRVPPQADLVCISVRSGFDLLLSALELPSGSEVVMSALTIPHMPAIVRAHGLVPVPLDIDPATMAPTEAAFEQACTDRTRVLVVAHLLGGRAPLGQIGDLARRRGVLVVEDCAQVFDGHGCPLDESADVALYSFGTIKTMTSLGGAVVRVRDPDVLAAMRRLHGAYPTQPDFEHRRKVGKAALLKLASTRPVYGAFVSLVARNGDLDERLHAAIAGFPDDELLERIRRRPSRSLRRMLGRRLERADGDRSARRARLGDELAGALNPPFELAGWRDDRSTHWVTPVLAPDADRLVGELRAAGFDATRWSSMAAVQRPPGHPCGDPVGARSVIERAVFVPCYPELSDRAHRRLIGSLAAAANRSGTRPVG